MINFFSHPLVSQLGWTILHSLWQGALIVSLVYLINRAVRSAKDRYITACCGLAFVVIASAITFQLVSTDSNVTATAISTIGEFSAKETVLDVSPSSAIELCSSFLETNIHWIVIAWLTGAMILTLRLIGSALYLNKLRKNLEYVTDEWHDKLQNLATHFKINKLVSLAQSRQVSTPLVLGYLNPIVVVPIGMFTGLSTEQIETIFIHELAHIKRHDYFVNIIQSVVEILFFFNPFVWMISKLIRREREYCCDDKVVEAHGNVKAYVYALAQIEEARSEALSLALSLSDNKNQLLYRIKRIMEKSFRTQSMRYKFLPVILLVVGLTCASWLTINADENMQQKIVDDNTIQPDTTIKKSFGYSRKSITTWDENGEPHEEVIEEYDGDEPFDVMPSIPPVPPIDPMMFDPSMAFRNPTIPAIPPMPGFHFGSLDTIPKGFHLPDKDWEEFSQAFEEKFKERFEDFYKKHGDDFQEMMKEMEENFSHSFSSQEWEAMQQALAEANHSLNSAIAPLHQQELALHAQEEAMHRAEVKEEHARNMEEWSKEMKVWEESNRNQLRNMEKNLRELETKMKKFEEVIKGELIKDGYIGKDEAIKNLHWDTNGEITVNGKKIKESDKKKYNELHRKYMDHTDGVHYVE